MKPAIGLIALVVAALIPADDSDLSEDPRGEPWDDEAQVALVQRYPRLAARFR